MAVPLVNTLEGGSDGTTITTGNSGGASGNAFDTVQIAATHALTYENSPVLAGSLCAFMDVGATSGATSIEWSTALGTNGPTIYTRFYVQFPTAVPNGSQNQRVLYLHLSGAGRASIIFWGSAVPGKFTWADAGDSGGTNSTMTMVAGRVYRFETKFTLSTTVGQAEIRVYERHSLTPLETLSSAANLNLGGTTINSVRFGMRDAATETTFVDLMAMGGFGIATADWIGPVFEAHRRSPQLDHDYSR